VPPVAILGAAVPPEAPTVWGAAAALATDQITAQVTAQGTDQRMNKVMSQTSGRAADPMNRSTD
jgi:hypothetical protein